MHLSKNIQLIRKLLGETQSSFVTRFKNVTVPMQKAYESGKAKPDSLYLSRLVNLSKKPLEILLNNELKEADLVEMGEPAEKVKKGEDVTYRDKYIALLERQCQDQSDIKEMLISLDELQKMVVATAMNVKVNQRLIEVVASLSGKKLNLRQEVSKIASDVVKEYSEQGIDSLKSR